MMMMMILTIELWPLPAREGLRVSKESSISHVRVLVSGDLTAA